MGEPDDLGGYWKKRAIKAEARVDELEPMVQALQNELVPLRKVFQNIKNLLKKMKLP